MSENIEGLPFVQARLPYINPSTQDTRAQRYASDRTTAPVRRWIAARTELRICRTETISCLEAKPGRGLAVTLEICEPERFDDLQKTKASLQEEIAKLEDVLRQLDALGCGWLFEIVQRIQSADTNDIRQRSNIASWAAFYTSKNKRASPEEAMQDPEFVKKRAVAEEEMARSKADLETLRPLLSEVSALLSKVGC